MNYGPLPERQLCAVRVCSRIARRWLFGEKYCEPCASSVSQAQYMSSLPPDSQERVKYRRSFDGKPPKGVTLPDPLAAAPRLRG
jgi:hypothetical protein